jgi:cellulose synthase/poly-beta-1,6-N-acetylglucosamine synthase-like glycosyltransferase
MLPKVSILVPVRNEPSALVCRTLDALARLDYPAFEVLVIESNTEDPALWEPLARHCARLGPRFRFFHLGPWPGLRAGALDYGLGEIAPDSAIVGVINADFLVSPHWLRTLVPAFADPKLGLVRSRLDDGSPSNPLISREDARAMILVRARAWGRAASPTGYPTDPDLALTLARQGLNSLLASESFGTSPTKNDFSSYRRQRFRAAYEATQAIRAHARALLSPVSFRRSLPFLAAWLPWLGEALGLIFLQAGLAWSAGLILAPARVAFPPLLVMLPALGLAMLNLAGPFLRNRPLARLALSHATAKGVLLGLTTRRMPAQPLAMAREEFSLLLLIAAAILGTALVHGLASGKAGLWCLILLAQSLPYLAAVSVSCLAALPPARKLLALLPGQGATL